MKTIDDYHQFVSSKYNRGKGFGEPAYVQPNKGEEAVEYKKAELLMQLAHQLKLTRAEQYQFGMNFLINYLRDNIKPESYSLMLDSMRTRLLAWFDDEENPDENN